MLDDKIDKKVYCSFCGKCQDEVTRIVAGSGVFICNECVATANDIVLDRFGKTNIMYRDGEGYLLEDGVSICLSSVVSCQKNQHDQANTSSHVMRIKGDPNPLYVHESVANAYWKWLFPNMQSGDDEEVDEDKD